MRMVIPSTIYKLYKTKRYTWKIEGYGHVVQGETTLELARDAAHRQGQTMRTSRATTIEFQYKYIIENGFVRATMILNEEDAQTFNTSVVFVAW